MGRAITLFFAAIVASCLASVAIAAASPNGTTIPPATQIIDSSGNIWTVSGGIYENGVLTVHSNGVALLLYDNNTLYYKTTAGAWWSWIGKRWVTSGTPPPVNGACGTANGTAVTSAPVANLCSAGTASSVTGTGPWTWSCIGSYGGATASCSASFPTNTIPATPTGLTATAGNAAAALSWTASSGATSYNVKRAATSGGPYTQIAAPTSTSYGDTSLTNGTTYYYVVSALDSAGESPNSAQVSATPTASSSTSPTATWLNVTPSNIDLVNPLGCSNYGTSTVQVDTANPGTAYTLAHCQGIWKTTDYGQTWTGPLSQAGTNGVAAQTGAGGLTLSPNPTVGGVPTLYTAFIRSNSTTNSVGFWKSTDGGVNWTNYTLTPLPSNRQDVYPPVIDPYNASHLLMVGHEQDYLIQSTDAGVTWTNIPLAAGMLECAGGACGTGFAFFIDTGSSLTTASTWLWIAQASGGVYGTWLTSNAGTRWTKVDDNEHPHGSSAIYQQGSGVIFMPGVYSSLGWGVERSSDYGQTWTHVGGTNQEAVVVGTTKNIYSAYGYPLGIGGSSPLSFEYSAQGAGTGTWTQAAQPTGLTQGPGQIAVMNDGTHNILIGAFYNSGLWRYIEP